MKKQTKNWKFPCIKLKKASQVQMLETIGVLIVFFVLIGMGLVFYYRMQSQSLQQEASEQASLRAVTIAQQVSYLPEVECSRNAESIENCIDIMKLQNAVVLMGQKRNYYYDIFQHSKIVLEKIYPSPKSTFEIYDFPLPKDQLTSQITIPVPIAIYDPSTDLNGFGVLKITVYS